MATIEEDSYEPVDLPPVPSPWEAAVVGSWMPVLQGAARTVTGLEAAGEDYDGAFQELCCAVMAACRSWFSRGEFGRPPESWIQTAVTRRRVKLIRSVHWWKNAAVGTTIEVLESNYYEQDQHRWTVAHCLGDNPEEKATKNTERARLCRVTTALRAHLPERQWAVMVLRHSGDLLPAEISARLGGELTNRQVSRLIYKAEEASREFLRASGMNSYEDLWRTSSAPTAQAWPPL